MTPYMCTRYGCILCVILSLTGQFFTNNVERSTAQLRKRWPTPRRVAFETSPPEGCLKTLLLLSFDTVLLVRSLLRRTRLLKNPFAVEGNETTPSCSCLVSLPVVMPPVCGVAPQILKIFCRGGKAAFVFFFVSTAAAPWINAFRVRTFLE